MSTISATEGSLGENPAGTVVRPARPTGPELSARQIRALQLSEALSRSLDLREMTQRFADELDSVVRHDGLTLCVDDLDQTVLVGQVSVHRLSYRLIVLDQDLGSLDVTRDDPFAPDEIEEIEDLICSLVYPLRNAVMYQSALRSAFRDPLTGTNNRAAMDYGLAREIGLCSRHGTPMSLLLLDADNFKGVNDAYGHDFGDCVLRAIASVLLDNVRNTDLVYRYGGDEFVVALSNTDVDGAAYVAERIREAVESLRLSRNNVSVVLSVSIGVTALRPTDDLESLFRRADQALYDAKKAGRNRVARAAGA